MQGLKSNYSLILCRGCCAVSLYIIKNSYEFFWKYSLLLQLQIRSGWESNYSLILHWSYRYKSHPTMGAQYQWKTNWLLLLAYNTASISLSFLSSLTCKVLHGHSSLRNASYYAFFPAHHIAATPFFNEGPLLKFENVCF